MDGLLSLTNRSVLFLQPLIMASKGQHQYRSSYKTRFFPYSLVTYGHVIIFHHFWQVWFQNKRSKERRLKQLTSMGLRPYFGASRKLRGFPVSPGMDDGSGVVGVGGFNPYFDPKYAADFAAYGGAPGGPHPHFGLHPHGQSHPLQHHNVPFGDFFGGPPPQHPQPPPPAPSSQQQQQQQPGGGPGGALSAIGGPPGAVPSGSQQQQQQQGSSGNVPFGSGGPSGKLHPFCYGICGN